MAPPDRDDHPRDTGPIEDAGIRSDSRLRRNAEKLTSWVEWLLHPEEHNYDRAVIRPGTDTKDEVPGPVYQGQDGMPLPSESVIEGYQAADFLRALSTVANQEVERESSLLVAGTAALHNLRWLGNQGMQGLSGNFPSTWSGPASTAASDTFGEIKNVANQVGKAAEDIRWVPAKYGAVITGLRDNANNAAEQMVEVCEQRFATHSTFSLDIAGILMGAIAAASFAALTAGSGTVLIAGVGAAWGGAMAEALRAAKADMDDGGVGSVGGESWRAAADTYMATQDDLLTKAKLAMDPLVDQVQLALDQVKGDQVINDFLAKHGA